MNKENETQKSKAVLNEEEVLKFWNENKIFEKSVEKPAGKDSPEEFSFYDGPPFATGLPHYGHLLQSFVKDAIPRYKTMRGFRVKRQWGWDCHGLPIENIVEKELGVSGRDEIIEKVGVKKFNETCRTKIFEYEQEWKKIIPRIGRWADMDNAYKTMNKDYMESEWWAFKTLYEKGLVYEDFRSIHICPRCETTLSQSEVTEGYNDIKDISVTAKFELEDEPGTFVLAWTTTPWTLPGNVALAVGEDIDYVKIQESIVSNSGDISYKYKVTSDKKFILAKKLFLKDQAYVKGDIDKSYEFNDKKYRVIEEFKGKDLVGKKYKPLFDYYTDKDFENKDNAWKIYTADFISDEDGTGIAHEAPAFGAEDMDLAKEKNLPLIQHVDMAGRFKEEIRDFAGMQVKPKDDHQKTDIEIIKFLARKGLLFDKKKIEHSYPHCWRCDTPLLNYATSSWFVSVEEIKKDLLKNAEPIYWYPNHIKNGRWGKWLEGARDWSISRNRFWANTIPVWRCGNEECNNEVVVGSIDELEELSGVRVDDLHKDVVDDVKWKCDKCGGQMRHIPDVLDTWFNSGSVPYATLHYPFENEEEFQKRTPADFIAEGQDQTRTWFYYQHVLSTALFGRHTFKNVITTGLILAEDGKKMSKSLKNYPDPMYIINTYGADAVRLYMLGSQAVRADNLAFAEREVGEVARKTIGRLLNVLDFYELYKDDLEHTDSGKSEYMLDRWIVARFNELHRHVTSAFEEYALDKATKPLHAFVDDLSTWYLRRSRDRLKGEDLEDKKRALETLRFILRKLAKLSAPIMPFNADAIWQKVKRDSDPESVHLANWCSEKDVDEQVLEDMSETRQIVSNILEARTQEGINVRQPLYSATVAHGELSQELKDIITEEVNIKHIYFEPEVDYEVKLDTDITPELAEEGRLRELVREMQKARKKAGLKPGDYVRAKFRVNDTDRNIIEKYAVDVTKQTFIDKFDYEDSTEFAVELIN